MRSPDGRYELQVLIGGEPQREYEHSGRTYVESKLDAKETKMVDLTENTPFSEKEKSQWPATPYTIKLLNHGDTPIVACVYVDGVLVSTSVLSRAGDFKVIDGFDTDDGVKEFLFSFPRFARDEMDRMAPALLSKLGTISATFHPATFTDSRDGYDSRTVVSDYQQANKKDADLAGGNTFTSTTRPGDVVRRALPTYGRKDWYDWNKTNIAAELVIHYKVRHVLEKLGVQVEQRDTAGNHKRLYGDKSTADHIEIPAHLQQAAAAAGPSYDLNRPIKQARIDLDD